MNEAMIDKTESNYTYTQVIPKYEMLAINIETSVNFNPSDLEHCSKVSTVYFCDKLMIIKHKSHHTCESAIFYTENHSLVRKKCNIVYYTYLDPLPEILDSGSQILLSNVPRPWMLKCENGEQIPAFIQGGPYIIMDKSDLCECSIYAGQPVWKIEQNIVHCNASDTKLNLKYTVNLAVMIYQFKKELDNSSLTSLTLLSKPLDLDPIEPKSIKVTEDDILPEIGLEPLAMEKAMKNYEDTRYKSHIDYMLDLNNLETWFTGDNSVFGAMFVGCILTFFLIPVIIIILVKYFGLKIHFRKLNSAVGRILAVTNALPSVEGLCVQEVSQNVVTVCLDFHTTLLVACQIIACIIVVIILYKLIRYLVKLCKFQNLNFVQLAPTLYKYFVFDRTDIYLQITNTFGANTQQIHIGTYFGNPEDLTILGELPIVKPLELETGCIYDVLSFNWENYKLFLRDLALTIPFSITIFGFRKWLVRKIFKSELGMYRIIAHNPAMYKVRVLHEYTRINMYNKNKEDLEGDIYMDMSETLEFRSNPLYKLTWIDDEEVMTKQKTITSKCLMESGDPESEESARDSEFQQMDLPDTQIDERSDWNNTTDCIVD